MKAGDLLELKFGERTVKVEVLAVADSVGKADASALEGLNCSPPYQELRWGASGLDWAFDGERLAVTGPYYGGGAYDWYTAVFAHGELAWLGAYSTPLGRSYCEELTYWGTYLDTTCSTPYIDAPYCRAAWTG